MDTNVKNFYSKVNNTDYLVVFGLSTCGYCMETKKYLNTHNIKYKYYPIDNFKELFFRVLIEASFKYPELNINETHKTVPVIFYKKKFIGGYSDLKELINLN